MRGLLGLALLLGAHGAWGAPPSLSAEPYGWCGGVDYPLTADEHRWCDLAPPAACPGLSSACRAERAYIKHDRLGHPRRLLFKAKRPRRRFNSSPIFWGCLLVGLTAVAVLLWRHRGGLAPVSHASGFKGSGARSTHVQIATSQDPQRLRAAALAAAARGDHAAAFALLYRALLWDLHDANRIRLHHARTHGDYLHQLRGHGEVRRDARRIFALVDRVEFGGQAVGLEEWRALYELVEQLGDAPTQEAGS